MVELEWVMDAELFEKFSSDKGHISLKELFQERGLKDDELLEAANEFFCLKEFLDAIVLPSGKSKVYYNNDILKEYKAVKSKLQTDLFERFSALLSRSDIFKEKDEELDTIETTPIRGTDLEKKLPYINVASFLEHKQIVSTCDDIEGCYCKCEDLMPPKIDYKSVCDAWEAVKQT